MTVTLTPKRKAERHLLHTERLVLVPAPMEFLEAWVEGRADEAASLLGVRLPAGWPTEPQAREGLPVHLALLRTAPSEWLWRVRLITWGEGREVVGAVNLKGTPDASGSVDVGWGVEPAWRRRGIAVEAAAAVIDWALAHPAVRRVTARIAPDNAPSLRVAQRLGMRHVDTRGADTGQPLLVWVKDREPPLTLPV